MKFLSFEKIDNIFGIEYKTILLMWQTIQEIDTKIDTKMDQKKSTSCTNLDIEFTLAVRAYNKEQVVKLYEFGAKYIYDFYCEKLCLTKEKLHSKFSSIFTNCRDVEILKLYLKIFPDAMTTMNGQKSEYTHDYCQYFFHAFLKFNNYIYEWLYEKFAVNCTEMFRTLLAVPIYRPNDEKYQLEILKNLWFFDFTRKQTINRPSINFLIRHNCPQIFFEWLYDFFDFSDDELLTYIKYLDTKRTRDI